MKRFFRELLDQAGISVGGSRPWDITVLDERLYSRLSAQGSLGFGEAYMDGWWEVESLDEFFYRVFDAGLHRKVRLTPILVWNFLRARLTNRQNRAKAFEIGEHHYDMGNDLYQVMLDERLTYTCAYWKDADNLKDAQEAKLDLVCQKIGLKAGDHVLDIGGGWGSFATYAAERYGASVVALTVSGEQARLGRERVQGLPVEIRLQDYREINESFDHVVSLGMFEHVGVKNYRTFMDVACRCLKDKGLFLLHTIGGRHSRHITEPWIDRYIFPGGMVPSIAQIGAAIDDRFVMEDLHNIGEHYDPTLMAWFKNLDSGWSSLPRTTYHKRFYRMMKYYLLSCAGMFRARQNHVWQIVLSKHGVFGGYASIR